MSLEHAQPGAGQIDFQPLDETIRAAMQRLQVPGAAVGVIYGDQQHAAGASYVFLHSDGDIRSLLDMLIDAGIDGINPLERRAHMDAAALRRRYPRLVLTGGMCNTDTLVKGPITKIQAEARELIDLGREGGLVIGTHSVSPEIPLDHFVAYDEVCRTYGNFKSL